MLDIFVPEIYRQLLVPPTITPPELSALMMSAFGWANCHMHAWGVRKVTDIDGYAPPIKSDLNPEGFKMPQAGMDPSSVAFTNTIENWDPDNKGLPDDATFLSLQDKYDFLGHKHILHYEYDMGDSWEHVIFVEKRIPEAEVLALDIMKEGKGKKRTSTGKEKEYDKSRHWAKITDGFGHGIAEDCGSHPGWEQLIDAYKAKGTKKDEEEFEVLRDWYENECANGDPKGLKGKKKLEHFDKKMANMMFEERKLMAM